MSTKNHPDTTYTKDGWINLLKQYPKDFSIEYEQLRKRNPDKSLDLSGAKLHLLKAKGVDLEQANLSGALLYNASLTQANLRQANLSGAKLEYAELPYANLVEAMLQKANLSSAYLTNANLTNANLTGAVLTEAELGEARLTNATLMNANLTGAKIDFAELEDADLRNANLTNANLDNASLQRADLRGANLTDADLTDACLDGALYNNETKLPADLDTKKHKMINIDQSLKLKIADILKTELIIDTEDKEGFTTVLSQLAALGEMFQKQFAQAAYVNTRNPKDMNLELFDTAKELIQEHLDNALHAAACEGLTDEASETKVEKSAEALLDQVAAQICNAVFPTKHVDQIKHRKLSGSKHR